MKRLLPVFAFAMTACSQQAGIAEGPITRNSIDENFNPGFQRRSRLMAEDRDTQRAFEIERKADIVVEYTSDGKMGIGIGRFSTAYETHAREPKTFHPDELIGFFQRQKQKNLVVVIFQKSVRDDAGIQAEVSKLNAYFRSYRRIVIQQSSSFSREILSDIRTN